MGPYSISEESLPDVYGELEPLFREHYQAMADRLKGEGVIVSPYKPRLDQYFRASRDGWLKTYVARHEGKPVGYCNVYVTQSMHTGDTIAQEDVLFVTPAHRGGLGKALVRFGLDRLRELGVTELSVTALTDLRVAKLWTRMGFKPVGQQMIYQFDRC
jgi:GNAT superfamily N-acetyltransferase